MTSLIGFVICSALIFYSGTHLSKYGDKIAEYTGIGKAWIGIILMASVTSLPELIVGIGSSRMVGSADLAVGDVLGSCVFNLAIISLLDAFSKNVAVFSKAEQSHVLACALSIILLCFVGLGLVLPKHWVLLNWIGYTSILFIIIYFVSIKLIYQNEMKMVNHGHQHTQEHIQDKGELRKIIFKYAAHALLVVAAALSLPGFAEEIAKQTGLEQSFVGTLFLATSTSLPEMAVSIAAARIGAIDIAVGNLIGSNLFNILILAVDDFFYIKGDLLKDASDTNIISVFSIVIMTAIAIVGLTYRAKEKRLWLAWDTMLILAVYIANMTLLYNLS